jgi:hypothetical protein
LTLNGLHGVISQKLTLFITTDVETSNPVYNIKFQENPLRDFPLLNGEANMAKPIVSFLELVPNSPKGISVSCIWRHRYNE